MFLLKKVENRVERLGTTVLVKSLECGKLLRLTNIRMFLYISQAPLQPGD